MPPSFRVAPNFHRCRIVCCAVFFAVVATGGMASAEAACHSAKLPLAYMMADEKTAAVNESAEKSTEQKTDDPAEKKRKRALAEYSLYVVWGIAAVGVLLVLMVILWGNRLRRETRTNPAKATKFDPLWYLRKPDPRATEKSDEPKNDGDSD